MSKENLSPLEERLLETVGKVCTYRDPGCKESLVEEEISVDNEEVLSAIGQVLMDFGCSSSFEDNTNAVREPSSPLEEIVPPPSPFLSRQISPHSSPINRNFVKEKRKLKGKNISPYERTTERLSQIEEEKLKFKKEIEGKMLNVLNQILKSLNDLQQTESRKAAAAEKQADAFEKISECLQNYLIKK
ncbi:uncharacterized protein LOC124172656 [Ischnura elegans]|uniref:uncharacterized protein LOC124154757 n=1 Tax=Ischnura elegans TaxID=197161 RepID=UPI001ED882B0|nr:uncharacterized protein LOC124154757 [Ischnura elegans]XP_046408062.1 uncharacterized protein LOC124172656 [Ischnura elegans]